MKDEALLELLHRHFNCIPQSADERVEMVTALRAFWSRDRLVGQWANVRDGNSKLHCRVHHASWLTIEDVIQNLMVTFLRRKPKERAEPVQLSTGYLARILRNALAEEHASAKLKWEQGREPEQLPDSSDAALDVHDDGDSLQFSDDLIDHSAAPSGLSDDVADDDRQDVASISTLMDDGATVGQMSEEVYAGRCLRAARRLIPLLTDTQRQIINCYLAPRYLDEKEVAGKELAVVLNTSESSVTRLLQDFGIRLPKKVDDARIENDVGIRKWLASPIGQYLKLGCAATTAERRLVAYETLCLCNREHLTSLKQ